MRDAISILSSDTKTDRATWVGHCSRRARLGILTAGVIAALVGVGCAGTEDAETTGRNTAPETTTVMRTVTVAESNSNERGEESEATGDAAPPPPEPLRVTRVIDGDTIDLANGKRIRLVQIDAPEASGECYGRASGKVLRRLLPAGAAVRLERDPRLDGVDRYGRLLRYVHKGDRNINVALVRRGAASVWFFDGDRGRYAAQLLRVARTAKSQGRGAWGACEASFDPAGAFQTFQKQRSTASSCAHAIPWSEADAHIGERATVEGPVAGAVYAAGSEGAPTFLNVGRDYPDPGRFTVVIWGEDRGRFPVAPEQRYAGETVCATGMIESYRGIPEIEVSSPQQLTVAG